MTGPTARVLKIFLASPGDVSAERERLGHVVEELNRTVAAHLGIHLELVRWETHARPGHGRPQGVINAQIGHMPDYSLFIGILWSRFGTPTGEADSGTEEEFQNAVRSLETTGQPEIYLYFCQRPTTPRSAAEAEQRARVMTFRESISKRELIWEYGATEDFERKVREHITGWLLSLQRAAAGPVDLPPMATTQPREATATKDRAETERIVSDSGMWLLLGNSFLLASNVSRSGISIEIEVPVQHASDDASLTALSASRSPQPYAHGNDAAMVSIQDARRTSSDQGAAWALKLKVSTAFGTDFMSETGTTGYSADDIANLRARRILLGEASRSVPIGEHGFPVDQLAADNLMLNMLVTGISTPVKVERAALVELAEKVDPSTPGFLQVGRLSAVYYLLGSNTVGSILDLTFRFVRPREVHVSFHGRRPKFYSNMEPPVINVEGVCKLP